MVTKRITYTLTAFVCLFIAYYFFTGSSDETQIKKQFNQLSDLIHKNKKESLPKTIIKTRNFQDLFTPDCTITLNDPFLNGTHQASELASLVFNYRINCQTIQLNILDETIDITDPLATVTFTAKLHITDGSGKTDTSTKEIIATLEKQDSKWLFKDFEEATLLEK